jgi:hypothetical protein
MAVSTFDELCAGFCELIAVTPPVLNADANGLVAFHVVRRGVTIILAHRPGISKDHFFALFELGPIASDADKAAAEVQALLEANFVLLQVHPPVFSRDPASGDVVLQYVFPLFETTPNGLHELIDREIDRVLAWRENLPPTDSGGSAPQEKQPPDIFFQVA